MVQENMSGKTWSLQLVNAIIKVYRSDDIGRSLLHSSVGTLGQLQKAISRRTPKRKQFSPLMLLFLLFPQLHHQHGQICSPTLHEKCVSMLSKQLIARNKKLFPFFFFVFKNKCIGKARNCWFTIKRECLHVREQMNFLSHTQEA